MSQEFPCWGRSNQIQVGAITIHYLSWGKPTLPTLVLLHGFLDHAHTFDLLANALSSDYYLVAWDARGHGKTDWVYPGGDYYFTDYIYDLTVFLEGLNLEKPVLIGHSMGGMIASLYAGVFPEKIKGLVNMEGWMMLDNPFSVAPSRVRQWIEQRQAGKSFKPFHNLEEAIQRLQATDPLVSYEIASHLAATGTYQKEGHLIWRHDPLHRTRSPNPFYLGQAQAFWENITCPTLLLSGALSPIRQLPDLSARLASFKTGSYIEISEAGHNLHLHQPDVVATAIGHFLNQCFRFSP